MQTMENLPSLPSDISIGGASLWAANTLLLAAKARGWSPADVRRTLLTLFAVFAADSASDEQIVAELRELLTEIRADRAVKS